MTGQQLRDATEGFLESEDGELAKVSIMGAPDAALSLAFTAGACACLKAQRLSLLAAVDPDIPAIPLEVLSGVGQN